MNENLKALIILVLPIVFWFGIVYTGFGAQSLGQIFEIPIVLIASVLIAGFLKKKSLHKIIGVIFLFVFLLRWLMPTIPE